MVTLVPPCVNFMDRHKNIYLHEKRHPTTSGVMCSHISSSPMSFLSASPTPHVKSSPPQTTGTAPCFRYEMRQEPVLYQSDHLRLSIFQIYSYCSCHTNMPAVPSPSLLSPDSNEFYVVRYQCTNVQTTDQILLFSVMIPHLLLVRILSYIRTTIFKCSAPVLHIVEFPGFSRSFIRLSVNPHWKLRLFIVFMVTGQIFPCLSDSPCILHG